MARVINQSIPPSLRAGYAGILRLPQFTSGNGAVIALTMGARAAQRQKPSPDSLEVIRHAASWLTNAWQGGADPAFFTARSEELRNLAFPSTYWHELTPTADLTDYAAPTVSVFVGDLNSNYVDPLRAPSRCEYARASRTYATPDFPGTPADPYPGWQGQVIDQVWRDLYFAQRRLLYDLPRREIYEKRRIFIRPLIASLEGQVTANASFRGVKTWFALGMWPYLYRSEDGLPTDADYLITKWTPGQLLRLEMPPDLTSNWACTATVRTLRGLTHYSSFNGRNNCNRLMLRVTTPPSRGVYFGRNDEVHVMHRGTIRLYQARGKYD